MHVKSEVRSFNRFGLLAFDVQKIRGHVQGLKNPFLCPDGRVATGEGRLAT